MKVRLENLTNVFKEVFSFAEKQFATDIYLREGVPPFFKTVEVAGSAARIKALYYETLIREAERRGEDAGEYRKEKNEIMKKLPKELKNKVTKADLTRFHEVLGISPEKIKEGKEIDTSFALVKGGKFAGRFRLNISLADGEIVLAIRRLYSYVPHPFDDLRLPDVVGEVKNWSSGLVIVTGPTGSGKSTTLAALMRYLSEDDFRSRVIVTIEKPIEYVLEQKNAFFIQREVGRDTKDFVSGVHNALRQHPDVILVGESRTPEEIKATLTASETGHLVFTTLHSASAWGVISRIVDVFPPDEQPQVRTILAEQLKLVIAQRLVTTVDFAVKAVCEVLVVDDFVRNRILEGEVKQIMNYMASSKGKNRLLNKELVRLVNEGVITPETAMKVSYDIRELQAQLRSL